MSGILLIRDLAVVLLIAAIVGWFCQRFKLSTVVGYLLAGAVIGPHTPPFPLVFDTDRVQTLAQVGLVFLIFSIGLGLSINRIKRLGLSIIIATAIAALLVLNGSRLLGLALGYSATQSLVLAGMLMVSSSAIIIKILQETQLTHERPGQLALGMTVLEDVVAVIMLTVLTSVIHLGDTGSQSLLPILASLGAFIVLIALLSLLVVPNLLIWLNKPALSEIRTLVIAGLLLGLAWLGVRGGYSLALGAFILGAIIGSTRYKGDIERSFEGVRQMFGAVFFVAIGMLVDFRLLIDAWPLVLLVTAFALFLRPIACAFGFIAAGNTHRDAIRAGLILTPIGEFSFVIAQLGVQSGAVPPAFYSVAVGASLITSLAAPLLTTRAESISSRLVAREPRFLREWIELYHDWLARLQSRQNASFLWRLVSKRLLQIALQVFAVSALILFAIPLHHTLETRLGENWLFPNGSTILFWTAFGLLLLAPLVAVWRNLAALSMILAESLSDGARHQRLLQPLIETALRTLAFILIAVWLLTLLPFRWSVLGSFAGVLLVLAAVTLLLWRRLIRLHSRLEIELVHQFQRASQAASASAWSSDLLSGPSGWNLDIEEITLPGDFTHAAAAIGTLAVRRRFGCSIVGVDRHGYGILNPNADFTLFPGDKLLLLGTPSQLAEAGRVLQQSSAPHESLGSFADLTAETLRVPQASPMAGHSLIQLDLIRRFGIQIGGIRRNREQLLAPSGHDNLQAGDELLVLGTHLQIQQFAAALQPPPDPPKSQI